ncbi:ATP-binding cassette sub-family A member 12 isoform X2 [Cyclopterus lumpus]|uniref:ATP-binding cassette sub-family A member 12 isoform X2 n=1 Tax=Cyclopterus lumpus TaxID=8103 RepID=UPI0014866BC3|nr:ATP-binding cassette sub-family A member 12 isoform X2 [Cyclopterus lumpus]
MAFFRQLKLLLWKNWLAAIRQPLWSVTLIAWPLIIFIIIAVARKNFPPVVKDTCYVGPRNLPSSGFFPFLQTLMCNTDSSCQNKSSLVDPASFKSARTASGVARPNLLFQEKFAFPNDPRNDAAALIKVLNNLLGPYHQGSSNNASLMNAMDTNLPGNQETLNGMLESVNLLKRAVCKMTLSMVNTRFPSPFSDSVVAFCKSNNTVLEFSLQTLNQILTDLMMTKPDEMMTAAGAAMMAFDQLQNRTSLWEDLLAIPRLFSFGSDEQVLASVEALLTNIQGALHVIESIVPEAGASLSPVYPLLAGGINLTHYVQNWPGKDVSISLGEIVTLPNDSLSEMVKNVLQEVKIPLDKAIGLTLDRDMVRLHLCGNSSKPMWLTVACSTGTVDMLLGWINPDKVAKQALLVWSKNVAPHDVSFAKGLLHSLMGGVSPGGQGGSNITRTRRSVDTQPPNIDEELFVEVGQVVLEIIKNVPELDLVVQSILRTGFQSMNAATLALDTVEEIMTSVLKDADRLQMTYLTLLTNQSEASIWIDRVLNNVMDTIQMIPKIMSPEPLQCEALLGPFEWLLNTESIKIELWRSVICQNSSAVQKALLMDWLPLVQKAQDVYSALTGQRDYNVTLPMILSQWRDLCNNSVQLGMLSNKLATKLNGEYWMNWMPDNSTHDLTWTLQQSVSLFMVNLGEMIEKTQLWPEVKNYFHMLYWILNYRPDITIQPANCSINISDSAIYCDTGLKWPEFVQAVTWALMSPNQDVLVNSLKGTVNLLQHVYGDIYKQLAGSYLKGIKGGDALSDYLINLIQNLDGFVNTISMLPDQNITSPDVMLLISNLLQSTGLRPLLPLLFSDGPLNVSAVIDVASKLGRLNQHIFTFNETDPMLPELEQLLMQFFSLEDLHHLLGTMAAVLSDDQQAYLSIVGNITKSLSKALMVAEQPGGLQSDHFSAAILDTVKSAMQIQTGVTYPLSLSVQQNILEIVQDSLKLIVQPDISFASSRNISLLILERAESIIQQTVPEMFAEYLLSGLKVATTYFESISTASGPDGWNQLILDEMETVQSLLPPNSTAQAYVSLLSRITHSILESGQGNMSLWESFESASVEDLPIPFGKVGKLLSMLWPLVVGGPGSASTAPSLGALAHLPPVLEEVMTGKADQDTWHKLEEILDALLSTLQGTEQWDSVPSVILKFEKIIGSMVNSMQAQNGMILSLQMPVETLISKIALSVNSSHFNLSEVSERMQLAIEHTVLAAKQANGTLECNEVLKTWEPVREAAGLSPDAMAMWCTVSLQPVLDAYAAAQTIYTHMNTSHMGVGPMTVNATSARIVRTVQSLYQVNMNSTVVAEQLIANFVSQLSKLASQPLSHEAQLHWYKQFQDMQLQNSLSSFKMLSDELVNVAPFIQPYIEAIEKSLSHILDNYHLIQGNRSSQDLFEKAAMIFLFSANITTDNTSPMMWGTFSGLNETSLTDMIREAVKLVNDMKIFGNVSVVYQTLEQFMKSNDSSVIVQKVAALSAWLGSTEAFGLDLLTQALPKVYDILSPLFSVLTQMSVDMPANMELFKNLAGNIIAMLRQLVSTSGLLAHMDYRQSMSQGEMTAGNHTTTVRTRHRRQAPMMLARDPMDDFIDLLYIDYPAMFKAISVPATATEMMDTVHVLFANPDLSIVVKRATSDMPWGLNATREETIDAALGLLSFFTLPGAFQMSSMDLLTNAVDMLPSGFPFSSVLRNITRALAHESQENLMLMQETIQTAADLLQINMMDPQFTEHLGNLKSKVCTLEETESVRLLMWALSIEPGQLCHTILPSLKMLVENLMRNTTFLNDAIFQVVIGDPQAYNIQSNWSSVLNQGLGFNMSSLKSFNINITSPGVVTVGELLRNKTAFVLDVQQHMDFDPAALRLLMETMLPNNNLEILSWLVNLRHCNSTAALKMNETDVVILKTFCSLSEEQWYSFSLLMARHLNTQKLIYRMVLSEEMQSMVGVMLQIAEVTTNMMETILPAVDQLQTFMLSIEDLNLVANSEFHQMVRGRSTSISSRATFVTLSRALCNKGILALLGISQLPITTEPNSVFPDQIQREQMIERFKIPPNATPFCMDMYLDMVNTTGGAIAWAFLKPMLMGQILYTPDTPVTRAIMEKANATLQEFANLKKYSEDWIESSNYIIKSAGILTHTLPMLKNSLGNPFVENFIELQTDINVGRMKETLSNFSNMTAMLETNKHIMNQVTTLSSMMVNISSCVKFDRYRGYDSADELNAVARDLAKKRDLYASVIFKLPKDEDSSRKRQARSSSASSLPPKVSYTIRMHMDNVMRTDRVRAPYFYKDNHISARQTLRYNRGFIYLQENIDRAIIETQTGHRVTEPAVQLQPFPYPCYSRDEYLEAISFVFPLMLMLAWVLFVADFVKKLVHERELRLHQYMKMMGVNPLSHFFAWFLECTAYLVLTIIFLTIVLKYGRILPNSDSFLLFLYLCDYGLSILSFSYLVSSFFDKTYIAGLSASLLYILSFFPFIVVVAVETKLTFSQKAGLGLFSPTCFSYASQYVSRYETQGEGIQWSNSYISPIAGDTSSFGWLCWLLLIDSILYFIIGAYIRMVFPGKYGIPAPWYFPLKASFWADLCCCIKPNSKVGKGLLFINIMQDNQPVFSNDKGKGHSTLSSQAGEDFSELPVGVALHGLSKIYGDQVAIQNLNVSFYEGHVSTLLGHNGAGKTTTMSLLTGLFAPSSGTVEVYGRDMQTDINAVRREMGVCMQYDVLFDHMTTNEHLLLYGQIKAPHWSIGELNEQVCKILEETDMYAHRHKRVGTLSGGMKRKLSISIAFIGGSRLVVLDEPTTGVDPCSRRHIWDIVIQHKKNRTIIMSTHHLDEAEVLSDRIAFLEEGGLKCCGSPFHLKDKLGQGYKLTLTKKMENLESERIDNAELKVFIQAHVPEARLKEALGSDLVYSLPPFTSSNASSYRSLLTALDSNLDALQLGGYGISDTTLEEVFLQLSPGSTETSTPLSISETITDTDSIGSFPSDSSGSISSFSDTINLTGSSMVRGMALAWQQMAAILIKRFHHSRRDRKGLIAQILLPVLFMVFAMSLGSMNSTLHHYPELELSPALYNDAPSFSFFSNQNPNSTKLKDAMMSFPGIDNTCLDKSDNPVCTRSTNNWSSRGNSSKAFSVCKCTHQEQICDGDSYQPPHKKIPSAQIVYNLSGINVENYLVATANDFIRNRYGGFSFGMPLPSDLKMDITAVPKNRTLSKVWFNPEGHHTMPAYLNSLNNLILRSNLPADKDPRKYAISVSSHPYFGRADDEDSIVQGMLQIMLALCVLTGYSITTASFAIYEVSEHHSGSKRLQHISGISEPFYWAVNFFYDMIMYLIPVTLTVAVIAAFQVPAFTDRQNLGAVTLLLVLFGWSTFPWMYLLSGVFKDAEMAFITYVCINLFISVNTIMSTSILYFLGQISMHNPEFIQKIFKNLSNAFLIFPQFNFGNGLMELARKNMEVQLLSGYGIDAYQNPFSTDALGWMFISSFIQGLVFFTLRLLLNRFLIRKVRNLIWGRKTMPLVTCEGEDEDVAAERLRVSSGAASTDILQVNQLTKVYRTLKKKVHAVKGLSVGIPVGECFGLLGENGAGKTTTFKMLTGDISPTDGTAQTRDWDGRLVDIMECRNKGINIGYCPQVDALDRLLTGKEHLDFYARIRGISKREIDGVVNYLLKRLELSYHRNIITDSYSCGTRRKLSTALALIGHPQILLLDEPSSGMDPRTKRHLWKTISEEVKGKCAVVLTSHSMEECEALCSRLAIMVKGQFRCLGSLQHIKNRFGSGFTVKMYLAEASCDAQAITDFMRDRFHSTYLKSQHSTMVEYHVPIAPGGLADIFDQLESNKNALQIKHFSVSQTTLDEVFINFAMGNITMESISLNCEDGYDDLDSIKAVET